MRMTNLVAAAAALSMVAAPAFAGPGNRAAKLSLAKPTPAKPAEGSKGGRSGTYVLAGLGVAAIIVAAVALSKKDSKSASS